MRKNWSRFKWKNTYFSSSRQYRSTVIPRIPLNSNRYGKKVWCFYHRQVIKTKANYSETTGFIHALEKRPHRLSYCFLWHPKLPPNGILIAISKQNSFSSIRRYHGGNYLIDYDVRPPPAPHKQAAKRNNSETIAKQYIGMIITRV